MSTTDPTRPTDDSAAPPAGSAGAAGSPPAARPVPELEPVAPAAVPPATEGAVPILAAEPADTVEPPPADAQSSEEEAAAPAAAAPATEDAVPIPPAEPADSAAPPPAEAQASEEEAAAPAAAAPATGDAVPLPTAAAAEPLSLERLEAEIRGRLKQVMDRAAAVRDSARNLLQRGRMLADLRAQAVALLRQEDSALKPLIEQERERSWEQCARIRAVEYAARHELSLRELTVEARAEAWRRYEQTLAAGSDVWFELLRQRGAKHAAQVAELRTRLTAAEARWLGRESTAPPASEPNADRHEKAQPERAEPEASEAENETN
jgi:hypothetical protein